MQVPAADYEHSDRAFRVLLSNQSQALERMATLADELQNDFADSGSEDEQARDDNEEEDGSPDPFDGALGTNGTTTNRTANEDSDEDEDDAHPDALPGEAPEETEARLKAQRKEKDGPSDMRKVADFMAKMAPILEVSLPPCQPEGSNLQSFSLRSDVRVFVQKIAYYKGLSPEEQARNRNASSSVEDNPEYQLLTKSNTFSTAIDDQATEVHKYIRDHYSSRFPELETLLPDRLEYTKAVAIIGNGPMSELRGPLIESSDNLVGQPLNAVLSRPKLMTVTVEATTTKGVDLPPHELEAVRSACRRMLQLESAKKTLTDFVQSRMNLFAPNLTRLIGSLVAAQLLNARGGLTALAETASSNISAIGSKRPAHSGFATNVGVRSQGYLYDSELIRRQRPELRTQAMRIVAAKVVLAARVDRVHESLDGHTGDELREQCEKRLDDLTKPPPNKGQRALPAPDDKPSKKRGGRRARKAKEAVAMTDIRKAQNRMAFGKEEQEVGYGQGEGTAGMGMIGQQNDGRIRSLQVDNRTRAKLSKKNAGWGTGDVGGAASSLRGFGQGAGAGNASVLKGHGLRTSGIATSLGSAGTASSLAFGARQGLELVDPKVKAQMERKEQADQDRWFKGGTFTQVGGGASVVKSGGGGETKDGFKIPSLPMKRKAEN